MFTPSCATAVYIPLFCRTGRLLRGVLLDYIIYIAEKRVNHAMPSKSRCGTGVAFLALLCTALPAIAAADGYAGQDVRNTEQRVQQIYRNQKLVPEAPKWGKGKQHHCPILGAAWLTLRLRAGALRRLLLQCLNVS